MWRALPLLLLLALSSCAQMWGGPSLLRPTSPTLGDRFGASVALSADALVLAVGAYFSDDAASNGGAAFVFTRATPGEAWQEVQTLVSPAPRSNARFGTSVSLSDTGATLAVGEPIGGPSSQGLTHIFHRAGQNWTWAATLSASDEMADALFGWSVSACPDGSLVAVGAHFMGVMSAPSRSGAVYLFSRNGTNYDEVARLRASNPTTNAYFGFSVSAASNTSVAVGAYGEPSSSMGVNSSPNSGAALSGAAYLFERNASSWVQVAYFKASNPRADSHFGRSIAHTPTTLVVGAWLEDSNSAGVNQAQLAGDVMDSGAVYVFSRPAPAVTWAQEAYIKADVATVSATFGSSVALSRDGNTLLIGCELESSNGTGVDPPERNAFAPGSGAAYIFKRSPATGWQQSVFLKALNSATGSDFGNSVAIASNSVVVGAETDSGTGAAYSFNSSSSPTTAAPSLTPTTAAPSLPPTTAAPSSPPNVAAGDVFVGDNVINGTLTANSAFSIVNGVLSVNGDLVLRPGSNVTLAQASIVATGNVLVSGPLTLQLDAVPMDKEVIQLLAGSSVSGEFSNITLLVNNLEACQKVSFEQINAGMTLSAIASVDSSACSLPLGVIAGIAAGAVLVALAAVLLIVACHRKQKAAFTKSANAQIRANELEDIRRKHG